jgi:hypothetical protein
MTWDELFEKLVEAQVPLSSPIVIDNKLIEDVKKTKCLLNI